VEGAALGASPGASPQGGSGRETGHARIGRQGRAGAGLQLGEEDEARCRRMVGKSVRRRDEEMGSDHRGALKDKLGDQRGGVNGS
jgi:hypothetical protein